MAALKPGQSIRFTATARLAHLRNADARPVWIAPDRFVFRRQGADGATFMLVDAVAKTMAPAFDHALVAERLGTYLGQPIEPTALPFGQCTISPDGGALRFAVGPDVFRCDLRDAGICAVEQSMKVDGRPGVWSPDGRWFAYRRGHDLWVRNADGAEDFALTTDGIEDYGYAGSSGSNLATITAARAGFVAPPNLRWSPDSRRLLTHRIDERDVALLTLLQAVPETGGARPKAWHYRYAMPDEPQPRLEHLIFDIGTRTRVNVDAAPIHLPLVSPIERHYVFWRPDGGEPLYLDRGRYMKTLALRGADPMTGAVRTIIEESSATYVEPSIVTTAPMVRVTTANEVIWMSRRSGSPHLYRYDLATGALLNAITSGDWVVRDIVKVDETNGRVILLGSGRESGSDAYYTHFYSVGLDGSDFTLLTPEDAEHCAAPSPPMMPDPLRLGAAMSAVSPSGTYFVETFSRPDRLPTSVLRRIDGSIVLELSRGELVDLDLPESAFPQPFEALAADGVTKLYGTLFRPIDFDPARRYPIVDSIYPGPQTRRVRRNFADCLFDDFEPMTIAQSGMIVFTLDGRGTPERDNEFVDHSYGHFDLRTMLDDHAAVIRQLADRYPWIDGDRAGIYGASGGGYATARAMFSHPETFKAGVSICGNHDQRGYLPIWAENYIGPDDGQNYDAANNVLIADRLQGKLFLIHGEMDDNVHPAHTLQLADALIKADKDFEMLIVPNANHGGVGSAYVMRRTAAFLARELNALKD